MVSAPKKAKDELEKQKPILKIMESQEVSYFWFTDKSISGTGRQCWLVDTLSWHQHYPANGL
jgi:hypothetical protein